MVAAISRLASLLKQATAGDVPLPTAKADPAKTALIKTLVTPRAPLGAQPMPLLAPPLVMPTRIAAAQKEASAQVIEAYRAALELEEAGPLPANQRSTTASGTGTEADVRPQPGLPVGRDDAGIRVQVLPAYALALPLSTAARQVQEEETATGTRRPAQAKALQQTSGDIPLEVAVSARMIAFGFAALALLLLIVLLVF
ncbi:hypothetical protein CYK37_13240 [Mesorhizobium loti]|nr:hypothetical protein [Mesorhizobium loti]PLP58637.1 hypothetical protein CYK37_13240 [Mesorhizobium loti]